MADNTDQLTMAQGPSVIINANVANYPYAGGPVPFTANTSLYVGDLHPDVSENDLTDKFGQIGPLALVKVCRNRQTNKSLGYGYVNFQSHDDAERALDIMNHDPIHGKPIRIMWSQRDPSIRKSGVGNIFIKNLSKNIDNKALYDTFSQFGYILSCKVALDGEGKSKGYGFIQYEKQADADNAIQRVNGKQIDGKIVFVGPHKKSTERGGSENPSSQKYTNIYVKNLPEETTEEELQKKFTEFGEVTSVKMLTGELGKFGFVAFASPDAAPKAVAAVHEQEWKGKKLFACRAQKKSERAEFLRKQRDQRNKTQYPQGVNLYLKYLDDTITDERLVQEFQQFGKVTSALVKRDENGKSKGFGFVCFSTPEEATKATAEMTGKMLGSKPLYIRTHQSKQERVAFLADYHGRRARASMPPMFGQFPPQMYMYPPRPFGNFKPPVGMPFLPGRMPQGVPMPNFPRGAGARPPRGQSKQGGSRPFSNPGVRPPYMPQGMPPMMSLPYGQGHPMAMVPPAGYDQPLNKDALGNIIHAEAQKLYPAEAPKITGMLLEMDINELVQLEKDRRNMIQKIQEAHEALEDYKRNNPQANQ